MLTVKSVDENGIGCELGLKVGDVLTEFDGKVVRDVLDYIYYDSQVSFTMTVETGGETVDFEIEKTDDETLGLDFVEDIGVIPCRNNCSFCFVSQLPKGMRKTLYVKDDDWRLSLISGNYVTLTNACEEDIRRIIDMKMSPLYISVHATEPDVRVRLLKNPHSGEIMTIMRRLSASGIKMHCQIVLCPGINDGGHLEKTLSDLCGTENVESVAVVPVGLTRFRDGLEKLVPVDGECARQCISVCERYNGKVRVTASDEMYERAGMDVPPFDTYGDFSQIENGVGIVAKFIREVESFAVPKSVEKRRVTAVCGVSGARHLRVAARYLTERVNGLQIDVETVKNIFFGESITVTGLITGGDLIAQLSGRDLGDFLLIPRVMLREFQTVFLDDVSLGEVSEKLGIDVLVTDGSGGDFAAKALGLAGND